MTDRPDVDPGGADPGEGADQAIRRRFAGHDPQAGVDTGGTPWAGRQLTSTGFDGDTGDADAVLIEALRRRGAEATAADDVRLVELVTAARLLVPVVAVAGEMTEVNGLVSDATSDMAAVTLVAPDGQRALPAFTSLAALGQWDASARPVPVSAQRAAQAAVQEGCHVIVLDPGLPTAGTLRGSMVWALAMGRDWLPAHQDPQVRAGVEAATAPEPDVGSVRLEGGSDGELVIRLGLQPGLDGSQVRDLVQRVSERVATDGEVRARIDAISFALGAV
ncbi:SseB family protein [Ornithinimicrobium cryptoxanthini]|uniref:SseB family protein n=1 Tax=Ornithinimicrobium cryptoxanthini TaxID=2934161 RepID=A0ABY4YFU0_9MICO|nr:SseB family protein [Ornithinimicrobium cryptoxanthini]USQ75027.1 SseB family protein [Ornithinimicrobium cryptoxanthini]